MGDGGGLTPGKRAGRGVDSGPRGASLGGQVWRGEFSVERGGGEGVSKGVETGPRWN